MFLIYIIHHSGRRLCVSSHKGGNGLHTLVFRTTPITALKINICTLQQFEIVQACHTSRSLILAALLFFNVLREFWCLLFIFFVTPYWKVFESLLHICHLLLSIFVLLHLSCCSWANSFVPPGLNIRPDLRSIIGLHVTDLLDSPLLFVHSISSSPSKLCLVVILCSSSSRLTSCLSSRAWLCQWPLCRWDSANQPFPPSPPPLASSPSPPCWPLKPSWPRRRKHLVKTATARRTERSPISRRPCSDTSDLSPHFAYSVSVTTDPRPAVSHWEHFGVVTVFWLLYLPLFDCLFYHIFLFLFQPVFLSSQSQFLVPPLHLLPPSLPLTSNLLSWKSKSETLAFREAVKLISFVCQKHHKQ